MPSRLNTEQAFKINTRVVAANIRTGKKFLVIIVFYCCFLRDVQATSVKTKGTGRIPTISAYRAISVPSLRLLIQREHPPNSGVSFMFVDEDAVYDPQNGAFFDEAYDIVPIDMATKSLSILVPYGVSVKGVYFIFVFRRTPATLKDKLAADPTLPDVVGYTGVHIFSGEEQESGTVTLKSEKVLSTSSVYNLSGKTYRGSSEISDRAVLPDQTLFSAVKLLLRCRGLSPCFRTQLRQTEYQSAADAPDSMGDIKLTKSDLSSALSDLKDPGTFPVEITSAKDSKVKTLTFTYIPGNIWDWKDLQAMSLNLSREYTLKNDITLPNAETDGMTSEGFEPVGTSAEPFTGTFNGNGFKIKNFFVDRPTADNAGLFGYVKGAKIENGIIELPAGNRNVVSANKYAGTWAGQITDNTLIDRVGAGAVGGLVGIAKDSTVRGYFKAGTGTIIRSPSAVADSEFGKRRTGGLFFRSTVTGYFTAQDQTTQIYSDYNAGGLVGTAILGTVTGYSKVVVKAGRYGGGLVGESSSKTWGYTTALVSDVQKTSASASNFVGGAIGSYSAGRTLPVLCM
ncbi:hypothetical protein CHS0354_030065 [Potamilus streckersoni]|uniref:Uncharacterized protein n=1 Tax=Potamilus streckersoni TaxID=2493646 RepID=A0AAE0RLP8_9BIVA|nr:hypothetical protein CHS0354_030065 [Potamilus streckersoni]